MVSIFRNVIQIFEFGKIQNTSIAIYQANVTNKKQAKNILGMSSSIPAFYVNCFKIKLEVLRFSDQLGQASFPTYQYGIEGCKDEG